MRSEFIEWNDNQQEDGNSELDEEGEEEEEQKLEDEEDEEEEQAENQHQDNAIWEPYTTRSGRRVRPPVWMRDYQQEKTTNQKNRKIITTCLYLLKEGICDRCSHHLLSC